MAVLDAVYATKRPFESGGETVQYPAFNPVFGPSMPTGTGGGGGGSGSAVIRLPPEEIQRPVRASFDKLRACYEKALTKNPGLRGRVQVRFVIARDGSVSSAEDASTEGALPDATATACIVAEFAKLQFRKPFGGGTVTVVYPNRFGY